MSEKILITGGAGFIGSHLVEYHVKEGNEVVVIDKLCRGNKIPKEIQNEVNLIQENVLNSDIINKASKGCKHIYHLAALLPVDIVTDNRDEIIEMESIGMKNISDAAINNGVEKVIYASTSGIYVGSVFENSATEDISVNPKTSYAIAKRLNEIYLINLAKEKGLSSVSLRFFNIYGKRQDSRMVLSRFLTQALNHEPITITGEGNQTRDFTYIDDVVKASTLLANHPEAEGIFNIARGSEWSIKGLAKLIKKITYSKSEIKFISTSEKRDGYEVERNVGDSSKLESITGYKPQTNLEEGIRKSYGL